MRTHSLIVIALRLYAIYWFVDSVSQLLTLVPMWLAMPSEVQASMSWSVAVLPITMLIVSISLWLFATPLAAAVARGQDTELTALSLTRHGLYCFAFVFLGLYFFLSSLITVIDSGYTFFTQDAFLPETDPRRGREILPFAGHALTMAIGFACVFGASKWSRKLVKRDQASE